MSGRFPASRGATTLAGELEGLASNRFMTSAIPWSFSSAIVYIIIFLSFNAKKKEIQSPWGCEERAQGG